MKGTLHKSMNYGWMVQDAEDSFYQLHPYDIFTNSIERIEGKEVDFILQDFWNTGLDEKLIKVAIISANITDVLLKQETLYTEEQLIEFTKWLASEWFPMWVKDKFVWEHDWEENQEGQKYQGYYTEKQLLDLFQSLKNKL